MDKSGSRLRTRQVLLWVGIAAWAGLSLAVLVKDEIRTMIPGGWCRSIK